MIITIIRFTNIVLKWCDISNYYILAIFHPFSQFCEIDVSLLSLQNQPKTAPNRFQRGVEYGKHVLLVTTWSNPRRARLRGFAASRGQNGKVCVCVYLYLSLSIYIYILHVYTLCMITYIILTICVQIYVCIYIYIYIHIHTHLHIGKVGVLLIVILTILIM